MAATSTRLLVLGAVRDTGAVHGYDLRRELLRRGADDWANVAPGSIYNALKNLTHQGLLDIIGTDQQGARPERTVYEITAAGEEEFQRLLRQNLRHSTMPNHPLLVGLGFFPQSDRAELAAAMRDRAEELHEQIEHYRSGIREITEHRDAPARNRIPAHVAESFRLSTALLESEAAWARDFAERLEKGELDGLWDTGQPTNN